MQLYSLNIFRAVAIVLVVMSHTQGLGGLVVDTFHEAVVWNVLSGATTLFVFISGFLFHHVFLKKFRFGAFFTKKLGNLVIPYLVLSFVAIAIGCKVGGLPVYEGPHAQLTLGAYLLAAGKAATPYWYIPFIISLFAMAPLHAKFATLNVRTQAAIAMAALTVALLVHRPEWNVGPIQNLVYYTPVYLIGMMCSQHRETVYPILERWRWPLLAGVAGLAVFEAVLGRVGNYHKPMLELRGVDLMLMQKLCMCLFLLTFLRQFESWRSQVVDIVADTSFAVFFLHPIMGKIIMDNAFGPSAVGRESWLQYVLASALCVATCVALALLMRRLFSAQSRLLTGY